VEVERLFPKDPQLKNKKSKYKEEENNVENIATNKGSSEKPRGKEKTQQNSVIIETH